MQNHNDSIPPPTPAPCAVKGCPDRGRPQVCPYDGRYHHHGMIHYGTIPSALEWAVPEWRYVCDTHYAVLSRELEARRAARCPHGTTDPDECATIRERSVAGISNEIPACPIHGEVPA